MSELPSGWALASLGDLCRQPEQRVPHADEMFTYIDIASVDRDLKIVSEPQLLLGADAPSRARKLVEKGDVIVSMTRPNLNAVALIGEQHNGCIASTGFDVLKPIEVDPRWIFSAVRSARFVDAMCEKVQGALYPAVKSADIREHEIPLPPLAEQTLIAQKLDELLAQVDTLKARLDAIPALLKRFRQSVLAAAVSGRLTSTSESLTFPASWKIVPLTTVLQDLRYGTAQKCDYNGGAVGVLRIPNIGDREITLNDLKSSDFSEAEINKLSLQEGDILIIRSNGSVDLVGKSAVVGNKEAGLLFAGYLIRLRLDRDQALPAYVNFWLKSPTVRQVIEQTARSTSGVNNINSEEIKSLEFTMPPLDEQTEIVRRVEQLFAFTDQLEAKIKTAQARVNYLTQSILAKAFRGELTADWRVANLELISGENSADVLLKKIKAERESHAKQPKARRASTNKKSGQHMSKGIITVTSALEAADKPLTGQQLMTAAGYPRNSTTEQLEPFFLDIREALEQQRIVRLPRDENSQDWFALSNKE